MANGVARASRNTTLAYPHNLPPTISHKHFYRFTLSFLSTYQPYQPYQLLQHHLPANMIVDLAFEFLTVLAFSPATLFAFVSLQSPTKLFAPVSLARLVSLDTAKVYDVEQQHEEDDEEKEQEEETEEEIVAAADVAVPEPAMLGFAALRPSPTLFDLKVRLL